MRFAAIIKNYSKFIRDRGNIHLKFKQKHVGLNVYY